MTSLSRSSSSPSPLQVGYGNAVGSVIFVTSFLGLAAFRRCMNDVMLILVGMVSFASGIFFMSFVTTTPMFYLGEEESDALTRSGAFFLTSENKTAGLFFL